MTKSQLLLTEVKVTYIIMDPPSFDAPFLFSFASLKRDRAYSGGFLSVFALIVSVLFLHFPLSCPLLLPLHSFLNGLKESYVHCTYRYYVLVRLN